MTRTTTIALSAALAGLVFSLHPGGLFAQDAGVAIEPPVLPLASRSLLNQARKLRDAHKLMERQELDKAMASPTPATLDLPDVLTKPLTPRQLAERGRKALLRIGWYYLCPKCGHWHLNLAGGYAITADGAVATCYHVLAAKGMAMRKGYLVATDWRNHVLPVTAVLADDSIMDTAIIRVAGSDFTPLPLNDRVAPGDKVYLYSDPMRVAGYFSSGMVNRFFWRTMGRHGDPNTLAGARFFRMHVSTAWAPGSSGAPVLDVCGNVVGHVSMIASMQKRSPRPATRPKTPKDAKANDTHDQPPIAPPTRGGATMMILHEAVPARGVRLLAESLITDVGQPKKSPLKNEKPKMNNDKPKIRVKVASAPPTDVALTIDLPAPGKIEVDGKAVKLDDLPGLIKKHCPNGEPVMIRPARGVEANQVGAVLKTAAKAGIKKICVDKLPEKK